jgi:hypothetical protein
VADAQAAYATAIDELSEAVDGERQVRVGGQALVIERFAAVVLAELGNIDVPEMTRKEGSPPRTDTSKGASSGPTKPALDIRPSRQSARGLDRRVQGTGSMRRHR